MKTFNRSTKYILGAAIATALSACGGDDLNEGKTTNISANNNAPTHDGDMVREYHETVGTPQQILLLGTSSQDDSGLGVVDTDLGNILRITNVTVSSSLPDLDLTGLTEPTGILNEGNQINLLPSFYAPILDTDSPPLVITYNYTITDGVNEIARSLTISITGEDHEPVVPPELIMQVIDFDSPQRIDLTTGVTDQDNEAITVTLADSGIDSDLTADQYSYDRDDNPNIIIFNTPSFISELDFGESETFDFTYTVSDHNHEIDRTASITIFRTTDVPQAPTIKQTYSSTLNTTDAPQSVDLGSPVYTVDGNGEPIIIDWPSITPTNGGPDLVFSKSNGTTLIVDPIDFSMHMNVGDTETFTYAINITDGDGGFVVPSSFELTITKVANANLISNGSFENGMTGWTIGEAEGEEDNTVQGIAEPVMSATAWDGDYELVSTGGRASLSTNIDVSQLSSYYVQSVGQFPTAWGRYSIKSSNSAGDADVEYRFGQNNDFGHKILHAATFQVPAGDNAQRTIDYNIGPMMLDDVQARRYSSDQGNNIAARLADNSHNFETPDSIGSWEGDVVYTNNPNEVISGTGSAIATNTGWATVNLPLPAGSVSTGKRYLLMLDIKHPISRANLPSALKLVSTDIPTDTPYAPAADWATHGVGRTQNFLRVGRDAPIVAGDVTKFHTIIDMDAFNPGKTDWESIPVSIQLSTNFWAQGTSVIIDNVQLIEIE